MELRAYVVTPFMTNCYLLKDGGEALVVDPGEVPLQLAADLEGCIVNAIVNTHCHCDHCGGNGALVAQTGAQLVCHPAELPLLHSIVEQARFFGLSCGASPEPDRLVKEGDTIRVGETVLRVLHTPGHSPGHIALAGDGFVIAGDVLFAGSVGRTDLPGGDHDQLLESIRTRLIPLGDNTVVYCGHGPATTIGVERKSNPFLTDV